MKDDNINLRLFLPDDIINLIICEYIKPDLILVELKNILNSNQSKKLNSKTLYLYLKNIVLKNDIVINSLVKNDEIFCKIHDIHINKNEKSFVLFDDPIESMALSWLMYLYH